MAAMNFLVYLPECFQNDKLYFHKFWNSHIIEKKKIQNTKVWMIAVSFTILFRYFDHDLQEDELLKEL